MSTTSGEYNLYYSVAPSTSGCGSLDPGGVVSGQIAEGALISYTFTAQAGEAVAVRLVDTAGGSLVPAFSIYDPTGADVVSPAYGNDVASYFFQAPKSGTYTVVVYDDSTGYAATGPYNLYFTLAPGADAGGALTPGTVVTGQLVEGALDSYTFTAQIGDSVTIQVVNTTGGSLVPAFSIYDPSGADIVSPAYGPNGASYSFKAPKSGTYTVIVYDDSTGYASTGAYTIALTDTPAAS